VKGLALRVLFWIEAKAAAFNHDPPNVLQHYLDVLLPKKTSETALHNYFI
jgi:hypothetical protein